MKLRQTNSAILLRYILFLITVVTFLFGLFTISTISYHTYQDSRQTGDAIIAKLKKTVIDGDQDWKNWLKNNTLSSNYYFVHVINNRKNAHTKNYYSANTKTLMKKLHKVPMIKNLYLSGDDFYYREIGYAKGIKYVLWISWQQEANLIKTLTIILLWGWIFVLALATFYAIFVADYLTKPLVVLNEAAKNKADELPVPDSPTEVAQLARSFNDLLRTVKQKNERERIFLNNAAHELKTPIASIHSHAQLLVRHGKEHPEIIDDSIDYIDQEALKMQQLVQELLDLAKYEDQSQISFELINLADLADQVVKEEQPRIKQKIQYQVTDDITVISNAFCLKRIIEIFLANAAKYAPEDTDIKIAIQTKTSGIHIQVIDQGPGVATEDQGHLFERFYRSSDARAEKSGNGLGLSIAEELAKLAKLQLNMFNNPDRGATFEVIITNNA